MFGQEPLGGCAKESRLVVAAEGRAKHVEYLLGIGADHGRLYGTTTQT